jgi:hypothetical protein
MSILEAYESDFKVLSDELQTGLFYYYNITYFIDFIIILNSIIKTLITLKMVIRK